ncbi:cell division topological specificity factor MinE [Roseococcus sp. SDR]|uniref:cell division topological specificity factor MinE n=1 Tax=Roseococcus sp. SDR TaxID=2835532 RepID=UPI001BCDC924|nr:cell division topological specificity factor MinE [Roseococcus sp. SDR]MBS7791071.1 cell division topological specificity factor MinE [Roseococcus sp. SDR]MBV1846385.1 cell division topological specificity factor MinE [Roseococcus sp. SDR]
MSWLNFFRKERETKGTAAAAKDRLQVIISHERVSRGQADFLPKLQQELVAVVARYVAIDPAKVQVNLERGGDFSTLAIDIELPGPAAVTGGRAA